MKRSPKNKGVGEHNEISSYTPEKRFPIVGIGASAGGLEALQQFFQNTPANTGMAYVVIQHLDPNRVGMMPELLQRTTMMKVIQVTNRLLARPDIVYVIPPNKYMSISNGYLKLSEQKDIRGLRLPIDTFFISLAEDLHEKSIGIILSGMGSDGSMGLKAIKDNNGLTMVQDPKESKFEGMPNSAISAVQVDIIASADELPFKLVSRFRNNAPDRINIIQDDSNKTGLEKIINLLLGYTGHDFSQYKKNGLYRRIERRMMSME